MAAIPPICDFGWKAIEATLPGIDGKDHSILDHAGPNGLVVVAFICNHCPYVVSVISRIVREANDLKELGIGFVAISANDVDAYPQDSFDNMKEFAAQNDFHISLIFMTQHKKSPANMMRFVRLISLASTKKWHCNIAVALDASRKETGPADLRRDLYEAMMQVAETGQGPKDQIASMGCSIKWKEDAA